MVAVATWLLLLLLSPACAEVTCYSYDGVVLNMSPCDPTAEVSVCCGDNDFCLSNGLCLNAGANNAYTQQGCTDEKWASPCHKYCPNGIGKFGDDGDYRYLAPCNGLGNPMCCGIDYQCCSNETNILTSIPKFFTLSRAAGIPSTSTGASSAPTTSSRTEAPDTSASATTASSSSSTPQSSGAAASSIKDNSVAVGAGVGVPLGVALIAAIGLLVWQMRKRAAAERRSSATTPAHAYTNVGQRPEPALAEIYTPQVVSELATNDVHR